MENETKPKSTESCDCQSGFGDILPKIMKLSLGEMIALGAAVLLFVISVFDGITFKPFFLFVFRVGIFTFILFLVLVFAEKFTYFRSKYLKLVNSILLGIATLGYVLFVVNFWGFQFSILSLIKLILILAANAYWAYDIIIDFVEVKKELTAKKKEEEAKEAEAKKAEADAEAEEKIEEEAEEKEDDTEETEEETTKDEDEEKDEEKEDETDEVEEKKDDEE